MIINFDGDDQKLTVDSSQTTVDCGLSSSSYALK